MEPVLSRRWMVAGLVVLLGVACLGFLSKRDGREADPVIPAVPSNPTRRVATATKPPSLEADPERETPKECDDPTAFRTHFSQALAACRVELTAAGCMDPLVGYPEEEAGLQDAERKAIRARCPAELMDAVEVDCAHFPCVVIAREDKSTEVVACLRDYPSVDGRPSVNGWRAVAWAAPESDPMFSFYRAAFEARAEQRFTRLERGLAQGVFSSDVALTVGCEAQQGLQEHPRCEDVLHAVGCTASDLAMPAQEVRAYIEHVEALVADHVENNEQFAQSDWSLDCYDVPCTLVVRDGPRGLDFKTKLGSTQGGKYASWWAGEDATSVEQEIEGVGRVTTMPVFGGDWLDHPELYQRHQERMSAHYLHAIHEGLEDTFIWQPRSASPPSQQN